MSTTTTNPAVYVGTYSKYNSGSIAGEWVTLTDYDNEEDFLQACAELHSDEADPELMFQDFEGFPRKYYGESGLDAELWEFLDLWKGLDEDSQEALTEYVEDGNDPGDFDEAYQGHYSSETDFAEELINDCYNMEKMMGNLACYFDYERFARDLFMCDYTRTDSGHVFRNL